MREFEESLRLKLAKDSLEDKPLYPQARKGWNIDEENYYTKTNLRKLLRSRVEIDSDVNDIDGPVEDKGENEIRESFDALLDFFGKLDYLLDIKVISKKEIRFFLYYSKRGISNN